MYGVAYNRLTYGRRRMELVRRSWDSY